MGRYGKKRIAHHPLHAYGAQLLTAPLGEHNHRKVAHINHKPQLAQLVGHRLRLREQRYDNPEKNIDNRQVANVEKLIDILTETGALRCAAHLLQ